MVLFVIEIRYIKDLEELLEMKQDNFFLFPFQDLWKYKLENRQTETTSSGCMEFL